MKNKLIIPFLSLLTFSCGVTSSPSSSSPVSETPSQESLMDSKSEAGEQTESLETSSSVALSSFSEESEAKSSEVSSSIPEEGAVSSSVTTESSSETEPAKLDPLDEPYIGRQYYLNHIGDIYSTWGKYRGNGVTVAVIDMGFNPYHEEFYYEDGSSKVSDKSAAFFTNNDKTETLVGIENVVNMGESHGTFCAGVVGAAVNGKGVAGIAPDCQLMLLKTDCKPKSIASAFSYAANNGAKVVTISIGSYYDYVGDLVNDGSDLATVFDSSLAECRRKGVVVCSAGGNGGLDGKPTEFTFPGCCDNVIGVGGLAENSSSSIWEGSSYNSSKDYEFCDVFAPANGMFGCCHYEGKTYDSGWDGTSFASPIVAGLAALYFEKNPAKSPSDFENDLYRTCVQINPDPSSGLTNDNLGHGRIDVGALLGCTASGSITVRLSCAWQTANCYVWNSKTGASLSPWPGSSMTKGRGFSLDVSASAYDSLIFNNGSNQTVDLSVGSFASGKTYSLSSEWVASGRMLGSYV